MLFLFILDASNITNDADCQIICYNKSLLQNRGNWLKFTVRMHVSDGFRLQTDSIPAKVLDITKSVANSMQDA